MQLFGICTAYKYHVMESRALGKAFYQKRGYSMQKRLTGDGREKQCIYQQFNCRKRISPFDTGVIPDV
jgi:hypothetical protein